MISLDSSEWIRLQHAYGSAADIPKLLIEARRDPKPKTNYREEPWFSLWSALCHQGDVYTASYASVPHLVQIAASNDCEIATDFFTLPTMIEIARQQGRGPTIPNELSQPYFDALGRVHELAFAHRTFSWSHEMMQSVAAAFAVSKGHYQLAECFIELDANTTKEFFRLRDEGQI